MYLQLPLLEQSYIHLPVPASIFWSFRKADPNYY